MQSEFDVIVIGGGPAGSTAASFLCRMGHKVLVLEREHFPRHHIGESMIAASLDVLAEVGLEEKLAAAGFPVKYGGCFMWGPTPSPWCIRFDEIPGRPTSYQVQRSRFDKILLDHSASLGVDVRQGHTVTEVVTENERVTGVRFMDNNGATHQASARYLIDASGLNAVVANRMSRRIPAEDLKNMCLYGYWQGEHPAPAGLGGEIRPTDLNNILIKMLSDGWLWFIPLGNGLISVGFVAPRQNLPEGGGRAALENFYRERVGSSDEWKYLLSNSEYTGEFHTIKDWSYRSESMTGPGYFAAGDAACFVDPILSSGAYLAILYAKMAAVGINTLLRFPSREPLVREWYEGLYEDTYTDYLSMARYWYHGVRKVNAWMDQAQQALHQEKETVFVENERSAFIGLATGNAHAHPNYVLLRTVRSFPLPLHLRKDPRGHYLKEARSALLGHTPEKMSDAAQQGEIAAARAAMAQKPKMRKKILEIVRGEQASYVDRLPARPDRGAVPGPGSRLAVNPGARLSLEIHDDIVNLVAQAPGGVRRVIDDTERESLAAALYNGEAVTNPLVSELAHAGVLVPMQE